MMGYLFIKRLLDLFGSVLGLLLLSPLLLCMAIWVSMESPGGPFYRQVRVGLGGRRIKLLKFRSMRVASDQKGLLTIGNDPRITRSGAFLRRYKLDELPQLWNVFLGEMSLVGPRPEVPLYVERYTEQQRRVLSVKPGITDWASIKYFEENRLLAESDHPEQTYIREIMPDKLALNLEYIRTRSVSKDIQILCQTFVRIFKLSAPG